MVNYEAAQIVSRHERIEKVSIDKFKETVHKVQQKGFDWILEAQKQGKVNNAKAKDVVTNTILPEKEHEAQKLMFKKISDMLKKTLQQFSEKIIVGRFSFQQDQEMTDAVKTTTTTTTTVADTEEEQILTKLCQDLHLV
jgi:hypothetical protein